MLVQVHPTGKTFVELGVSEPYHSPLKVEVISPDLLVYSDSQTGQDVGKVYRTMNQWWVDAIPFPSPFKVPEKYIGFLFIRQAHITLKNNGI
jgi:hypothetical protein